MKPEHPKEIPGVCKSSRVKFQTKQDYIHSITGSKCAVSVAQLEDYGALHPYTHMLFMIMQEEKPYIITVIVTQLLLKAGFKEWGTKYQNAVHS